MSIRTKRTAWHAVILAVLWCAVAGSAMADASAPVSAAAAPVAAEPSAWAWEALPDQRVTYRGLDLRAPSMAETGPRFGGPLWFGVGVSGGGRGRAGGNSLAAVVVGAVAAGVIVATVDAHRREAASDETRTYADGVLVPVQDALRDFHERDLQARALDIGVPAKLPYAKAASPDTWLVQGVPWFSMTSDAHSLVLDHEVYVHRPGSAELAFQGVVHVVGAPETDSSAINRWRESGAEQVKAESARLLADSVALALEIAARGSQPVDLPLRTVYYQLGHQERGEYAQVVSQHCDRMVLRTDAGQWMSVPVAWSAPLPEGCPARAEWPADPATVRENLATN